MCICFINLEHGSLAVKFGTLLGVSFRKHPVHRKLRLDSKQPSFSEFVLLMYNVPKNGYYEGVGL